MPISADCPQCGKTYRVKDDFAGKKFRCKQCQGVVSVPAAKAASGDSWDDLDLGEFQDRGAFGDDEFGAPPAAPRRRTAGKKKARAKSRGGGMPITVIVAVVCESILALLRLVWLGFSVVLLDCCGGVMSISGLCLSIGALIGYFQRINVIRWISVALCGVGMLILLSCGGFMAVVGVAALPEAQIPEDQVKLIQGAFGIFIAILFAWVVMYGTILGCLITSSAGEYFDR